MSIKLDLDSKTIFSKEFKGTTPGYDALEVDEFLDKIINDYRLIEQSELLTKDELEILNNRIEELRKENDELKIRNASLEKKMEGINDTDKVTPDNMSLVQRINKLELFLWKKGYDPNTIK